MSDQARALPDMSVRDALRSPAIIFYTYDVDNGALLRDAADRIEALETEVERLTRMEGIQESICNHRGRVIQDLDIEVERLTRLLQEEQAESLRQAEIARDALTKAERLAADNYTLAGRALHAEAEVERLTATINEDVERLMRRDVVREAVLAEALARVAGLEAALRVIRDMTYYKAISNYTDVTRLAYAVYRAARAALAAEKGEGHGA